MVFSTVIMNKYTIKRFILEIGSKLNNILCKKFFYKVIMHFTGR